jgi:hypothetical protein
MTPSDQELLIAFIVILAAWALLKGQREGRQ